jgi:hypothetical protein
MNEPDTIETSDEIAGQISALQRQVFILLLALVIVSGSLVTYLYYQSRILGENTVIFRQQAQPINEIYAQNQPIIQKFVDQIRVYGVSHPDFAQQILKKYQIPPTAPAKK